MTRLFPQSTDPLHRVDLRLVTHCVHATGPSKRARNAPNHGSAHMHLRFHVIQERVPDTRGAKRSERH